MDSSSASKQDKFKALDAVAATLNKKFETTASLVRLGAKVGIVMPHYPTDIPSLDYGVLGIGGIPKGRIIEVFGPESAGKTTATLEIIGADQRRGNLAAFVDAEHALDPNYAKSLGVNVDELYVSQPDSGEQALDTVIALVESKAVSIVVVDSVAALVPQAELDGDMGDSVPYETPVLIRKRGSKTLDIFQVGDLYGKGKQTGWYRKTSRLEILTHKGWQRLLGVQKKLNIRAKKIIYTRTAQGYVGTTEDHSLFVEGVEKSPRELSVFDRVDTYDAPIERNLLNVVTEDIAWLLGFYVAEGSTPRTKNTNRFEVCNTVRKPLEKCVEILKSRFGVIADIEQRTEQTDLRKPLLVISVRADETLGWFMQQCVSERSLTKKIPSFILNGNKDVTKAFLDGFWEGDGNHSSPDKPRRFFNNSWLVMAGIKLLNEAPTSVSINTSRPEQLTLSESGTKTFAHNEIRGFYESESPEYLYDLETEAGTFVTGVGNIICHNSHMGLQARLMSQAMRKLRGICAINGVTVIFINQIREKIGVMFGSPETTTGGRALKFYASVRLDVRRIGGEPGRIMSGGVLIGHKMKIKAVKNKVGSPFRETIVDVIYGKGIDRFADLIGYATEVGAMEKGGGGYIYFKGERIAQGVANAVSVLREKPEIVAQIRAEVAKAIKAQQEADV